MLESTKKRIEKQLEVAKHLEELEKQIPSMKDLHEEEKLLKQQVRQLKKLLISDVKAKELYKPKNLAKLKKKALKKKIKK
jgi:hypothetical protein